MRRIWIGALFSLILVGFLLSFASGATANSSYKVLYSFKGSPDGNEPQSDLAMDAEGNLYGTTSQGGSVNCTFGCGTVFELKRTKDGWKEEVAYSFTWKGGDGRLPMAGVTLDGAGNLYGATAAGGSHNDGGTIFKLTRNPKGGGWTEQVLYQFTGESDGSSPNSDLVFDKVGNLYGTTPGATYFPSRGIVFELSPQPNGSWTETTVYSFQGAPDGQGPVGKLALDGQGNIYGITATGGSGGCVRNGQNGKGCGTIYELTPGSSGWTETILYNFVLGGGLGNIPSGGLILDTAGDLYGTTQEGGDGYGTVFELAKAQKQGWQETVLYRFYGGPDGISPVGGLAMSTSGDLYGATTLGGNGGCGGGCGAVFKMHPGLGRREVILHAFANGSDGANPRAGVIVDAHGALYGTTSLSGGTGCGYDGAYCGTVYEIEP